MRYLPLIWAGLWRKPARTVLTFLAAFLAFLLFGLLQGTNQALAIGVANVSSDRLWVVSRNGGRDNLPLAHLSKMRDVDGIVGIAHATGFGGFYQDPRNTVSGTAADVEAFFAVFPELHVAPEQLDAMRRTATGALVGSTLAERFGWQVGDRVPLTSEWTNRDGTNDWVFDIVGIFGASNPNSAAMVSAFTSRIVTNYRYFDEARAGRNGTVSQYFVRIANPRRSVAVGDAIDALFANSAHETRTETESQSVSNLITEFVDLNFLVTGIVGSVLFTLFLVTGNTVTQSLQERIGEFAVLKTVGYTDGQVFRLVVVEPLVVCVSAALLGLFAAGQVLPALGTSIGLVRLPPITIASGLAIAVTLALVCGFLPAQRARRLSIVDALGRR